MLNQKNHIQSPRKAYGEALLELGRINKNIVALDADLSCSTQSEMFAKEFPERFFNMGIAEADMMTTAAGLAVEGKIPFASTFAMFATARCLDQIRNSICYPSLNVKIIGTHGGITVGEDGASHQALEDVSFMRSLPNMTVIVPADYNETKQAVEYAAQHSGPFYIRISRTSVPDVYNESYKIQKGLLIKEGKDVTLISNGETLIETINASKILETNGIDAEIISMPFVKPFASDIIIQSAAKTRKVITIENHSIIGGLGSTVCEVLSENYPTKLLRIGTLDKFGQSGEQRQLMEFYGLTAEKIAQKAGEFLKL